MPHHCGECGSGDDVETIAAISELAARDGFVMEL
jgi:hypothetical protein